ncbi:MAG: TlpA disulfide reductase family protein [Alphaproteobacteria bacterium]|nr:TlpA disulfide reductase family protein [Alphaproteobacteria bacterium]
MRAKLSMLTAAGFCALFFASPARAAPAVGDIAPSLSGPELDGSDFDLAKWRGKVVIVNFWATWCPPCHEEMPALEAVWRKYHGEGLEVIAVSADRPRARGDVKQVMHYFTYPAAMLNMLGKNDFGTPDMIPITYVIDKDGIVQNILRPDIQELNEEGLGDEVKSLLAAKVQEKKPEAKTDDKP